LFIVFPCVLKGKTQGRKPVEKKTIEGKVVINYVVGRKK
jgi:hypothetical protein